MSELPNDLSDLLREMRGRISEVEEPGVLDARRDQVVHRLRNMQFEIHAERATRRRPRRAWLALAALPLALAAAAAASYGPRSFFTHGPLADRAPAVQAARAEPVVVEPRARDTEPVPSEVSSESAVSTRPGRAPVARGVSRSSKDSRPSSTLAAENALLGRALGAARAGNDRQAVRLLDDLLARYPSSELAENAKVERFRALVRLGDARTATREARRYLAEQPDGMATDEARRIAIPVRDDAP